MPEENKGTSQANGDGVADAGTSGPEGNNVNIAQTGNANGASPSGEPGTPAQVANIDLSQYVPKKDYEELAKKMGEGSEELGNYREFFKEITPLLDKMQDMPEVAEVILEGKLTSDMATAIMDGKVSIEDATVVAQAHEKVKKDLGGKVYNKTSPEEIENLVTKQLADVDQKIKDATTKFSKDIGDIEEKRKVEGETKAFIKQVGDFEDYAEGVVDYLGKHPNVDDIETAYFAVKGLALSQKAADDAKIAAVEEKKTMAANAGGGMSQGRTIISDKSLIDSLIPGSSNANQ